MIIYRRQCLIVAAIDLDLALGLHIECTEYIYAFAHKSSIYIEIQLEASRFAHNLAQSWQMGDDVLL